MTKKTAPVRLNVEKVCEQYRFGGPMNRVNLRCAAAQENKGTYIDRNQSLYQIQIDDKGQIIKYTQSKVIGYNNGQPIQRADAVLFNYNNNGDITQITLDNGDDGDYENIHNYNCVYDENNNLVSREETTWSKIKNGYKAFIRNMPINK